MTMEILLVEDNDDDIVMTMESFAEANIINKINVVRDGEEALNYLRKQGSYEGVATPGLILMDINMPKKNGFEVLAELKAEPSLCHIPVVILTTSQREEDIVKSFAAGACSYIPKPVGFDNFIEVARQFSMYWELVSRVPSSN
ncbi:MAG: response regulator [Anaerolineales bacterium]|nr:response regulator [Anaerolineales bacterium]MCB0017315.1 response regulator [Anaerolineales bacterium]MCB8961186.1 response regulator [Ardenticatenales bacterium]